jgi:hypothetical protein
MKTVNKNTKISSVTFTIMSQGKKKRDKKKKGGEVYRSSEVAAVAKTV